MVYKIKDKIDAHIYQYDMAQGSQHLGIMASDIYWSLYIIFIQLTVCCDHVLQNDTLSF
jgi:hypothetical protein